MTIGQKAVAAEGIANLTQGVGKNQKKKGPNSGVSLPATLNESAKQWGVGRGTVDDVRWIKKHSTEVYEKIRSGSTFSKDIKDWLGMSSATATRWCKIGENADLLLGAAEKLPMSSSTIYKLTTLPEKDSDPAIIGFNNNKYLFY